MFPVRIAEEARACLDAWSLYTLVPQANNLSWMSRLQCKCCHCVGLSRVNQEGQNLNQMTIWYSPDLTREGLDGSPHDIGRMQITSYQPGTACSNNFSSEDKFGVMLSDTTGCLYWCHTWHISWHTQFLATRFLIRSVCQTGFTTLDTGGCCCPSGSATVLDSVHSADWGSPYNSLMLTLI